SGPPELQGIMQTDTTKAILSQGDKHYTVSVGESVGSYRVQSIDNGEVVLSQGGQSVRVKMNNRAKTRPPKPVPPPAPVAAPAPEPQPAAPALEQDPPPDNGGWRHFELREEEGGE
ncbi:MAG: hypothetical protein KC910_19400, partial [Candidatus Eremiobacteraeota bacterium]|nr:hypothetical protein [Candidatus Eremiobacteraeota bacterium]